jgi:hypothetical protein
MFDKKDVKVLPINKGWINKQKCFTNIYGFN